MKFTHADIDAIKRDNPVTKIAGAVVALRAQRQGAFPFSGPCPLHSPDPQARDSTSFACSDEAWVCTSCGGGDVVDLVARMNGLDPKKDFRKALELLTGGRAAPQLSADEARALEEARTEEAAARYEAQNEYRDREQRVAWDLYYKYGMRLSHPRASIARDYLGACRGLRLPDTLWLRFNPEARYYVPDRPKAREIHRGPALLAPIQRGGRFCGVHQTFIDLKQPNGKAVIVDPKTSTAMQAKKVRGSMKGGHIDMVGTGSFDKDGRERPAGPRALILGEGIEKVGAVMSAMLEDGRDVAGVAFWSAMNLGNMGGKALRNVPHPTLKGATGRPLRPGGPEPDMDTPAIEIPDSVERLVLLGDRTSDPFETECVMARAAARYAEARRLKGEARLSLEVVCAWGPDGKDFDDVLREAA
jgi:hypothetical protein